MKYEVKITHEDNILYDKPLIAQSERSMQVQITKIIKRELPDFADLIEGNPCKWV